VTLLNRVLMAFICTLLAGMNFGLIEASTFFGTIWAIAAGLNFCVLLLVITFYNFDRN